MEEMASGIRCHRELPNRRLKEGVHEEGGGGED